MTVKWNTFSWIVWCVAFSCAAWLSVTKRFRNTSSFVISKLQRIQPQASHFLDFVRTCPWLLCATPLIMSVMHVTGSKIPEMQCNLLLSSCWSLWLLAAMKLETDLSVPLLQQCYVMDQNGARACERGDEEIIWLCGDTQTTRETQSWTAFPATLLISHQNNNLHLFTAGSPL